MAEKLAAIVTTGDLERLAELAAICNAAAIEGVEVHVFFRDESIPAICRPDARQRLGLSDTEGTAGARIAAQLTELAQADNAELYACSTSLYVWGATAADLIPAIAGARGLIAFLADDLDGATRVLSY